MSSSREIGLNYEASANNYLGEHGIKVIENNFHSQFGEIDIIGMDKSQTLIFVEVRYRRNKLFGTPQETISASKIKKLIKTAQYFLVKHKRYMNHEIRFDVIAITGENGKDIQWIQNAFDSDQP